MRIVALHAFGGFGLRLSDLHTQGLGYDVQTAECLPSSRREERERKMVKALRGSGSAHVHSATLRGLSWMNRCAQV